MLMDYMEIKESVKVLAEQLMRSNRGDSIDIDLVENILNKLDLTINEDGDIVELEEE
jgi:hypothetical protein